MSMKRFTALLLTFIFLFTMLPTGLGSAKTIDELKAEKEDLVNKINQKQQELDAIENEVERNRLLLEQYQERLDDIMRLMDITKELIEIITIRLATAQQELDARERDLREFYEIFGKRLRYLHMNDSATPLSVIFGADSFSDAIVIGQLMTKMAQHDTELIDNIAAIRQKVENLRDSINRDLADKETQMEDYEAQKEEAALLVWKTQENLSYAEAERWATQAAIDEYMLRLEQAQAEINQKMAAYSDEPYVGGIFKWPLPGFGRITSPYGWRTLYGQSNFHTGIDIAGSGVYGASIIASNQGKVTTVVYGSYGYGYYIIIDHGGGYMTLYGHLSAIYVVEGEKVSQGTVIGAVGSTGNSTGPHLHFEIRLKGEKLDPMTIFTANG